MSFAKRDVFLEIPKKLLSDPLIQFLKSALTFKTEGYGGKEKEFSAWAEKNQQILLPRFFWTRQEEQSLPFHIEETIRRFPLLSDSLKPIYPLKEGLQQDAFTALVNKGSGILSLPCGAGKTVIALHAWLAVQHPCLVIAHTDDLLEQWRERILEHTTLHADDIGVVKGDKMVWEGKAIVLASLRTLALRTSQHALPDGFTNYFGVSIWDECHHLGAPLLNKAIPATAGVRWGLSATPERGDGMEKYYLYHFGPYLYVNRTQASGLEAFFIRTKIRSDEEYLKIKDNASLADSWLAQSKERNDFILKVLPSLINNKVTLIMSPRPSQLELLHKHLPGSGLLTGEETKTVRSHTRTKASIILATTSLVKEALDRPDLELLIILVPFTGLTQALGRVLPRGSRAKESTLVVFEDALIRKFHLRCKGMRSELTSLRYPFHLISTEAALNACTPT